ncbi:protein translocase subunit SecDF [Sanyastnella coralliicola]|uniref:protein translocase subunit SecDF n=1 Tax=Sanyastnella coralliicola TaxID=3069118 RepID=UPI0027BA5DE4|nr:protein translocase subunit SecDF [Longitalea sp. SCSIO 12813]
MQNKSAVLLFTILLALATVYILSFNFVANRFEATAQVHGAFVADSLENAGAITAAEKESVADAEAREFLRDSANAEIYPVFGHTYKKVKANELNLGLDLQGGMSVTLEVAIDELIIALSDYSDNADFLAAIEAARVEQKNANTDFVSLFADAWEAQGSPVELWRIFHNMENKDLFPAKSTDDEIIEVLRNEAETAINNSENIIRKRIDQYGVAQPNVQKLSLTGRILVELPGVDDPERIRENLKATANLEFWETYYNDDQVNGKTVFERLVAANNAIAQAKYPELFDEDETNDNIGEDVADAVEDAVDAVVDAVEDAVDGEEMADADSLDIDEAAPDSTMSIEEQRKRSPLFVMLNPQIQTRSIIVGQALTRDITEINKMLAMPEAQAELGPNLKLMWEAEPNGLVSALYAIRDDSGKGKAKLDGKTIVDARVGYDQIGDVVVTMKMDSEGTATWAAMTTEAANDGNRQIAVTLDDLVYSAPSVNSPITGGSSEIQMGSGENAQDKFADAEDLAGLLKAGSLPAKAKIVNEVTIGPELGEENINAGLWSFVIALLVILVYMVFYYKGAGLVSDIALIANLFFLIGALASLGAALTLPGIAGIVLTIGMAVDANVLIYERIREEMRGGKGMNLAVKEGYAKAYSAIIDANLTTLFTAIVLYAFGSGPIRGFATTLIIGIFTSLFSAIVLTRLIFFTRMENKKALSFYTETTKNWFTKTKIDFVGKRRIFYVVSGIIIAAGIGSLVSRGLDYGTEFTGGTTVDILFEQPIDLEEARGYLREAFTENGVEGNPKVQTTESDAKIRVTTNYLVDYTGDDVDQKINDAFDSALSQLNVPYTKPSYQKVDSSMSDDFTRGAMYATIFSLLVIFLYLVFRFRRWQFGLGALIAMAHDVIIVLSLFSIFYGILPFSMQIDQAFIAAILTVIGYSINDTVVVFDRIREYLGLYGNKHEAKEIMNNALNSTLSRTVNTSLSTFVVLLTIFILGGDNIKGFVFALMVGVIVGTYSSIFIATPSVLDFTKDLAGKKK